MMESTLVTIAEGQVQGRVLPDYNGRGYYCFQGIPYGEAPVGELRFAAPRPMQPWKGVKDCTKEGSECLSKDFFHMDVVVGSEDCLILNVYTPKMPDGKTNPLPVMFWIHGGGFTMGSSKTDIYGPDYLMTADVVLVTINYRLGVFGFLSCEDPSLNVPGNSGFKDMVLALKWVQRNIKCFNGDPNNVTVFGESAGGASTHLLVLSPMTKGLFHRAILQSGCAINPWAVGTRWVKKLAGLTGFNTEDEGEALRYLRSLPAQKLLEGQFELYDGLEADVVREMGYVVETGGEPAFMDRPALEVIKSGEYNKVPMMIGYTDREGLLTEMWYKSKGGFEMFNDFETKIPHRFRVEKGTETSRKMAGMIKSFYFKGKEPSLDELDGFFNLETDRLFLRGLYMAVKHHCRSSPGVPIYFYRFTIDRGLNFYKKLGDCKTPGAAHCDDLGYLFKTNLVAPPVPGSVEHRLMMRMVKLWTNFAKTGNPNPIILDESVDVVWRPVREDNLICLDIGEQLKEVVDPDKERMMFWDELSNMTPHAKDM